MLVQKKVTDIVYNHKNFSIFIDSESNYIFYEIGTSNNLISPSTKDFLALTKFLSFDPSYSYSTKKSKALLAGVLASLTIYNSSCASISKNNPSKSPNSSNSSTEKIKHKITDLQELDTILGYQSVTREEIYDAINNNSNLNEKHKLMAKNVIDTMLKNYPKMDTRIFYENIKTLNIVNVSLKDIKKTEGEGSTAYYYAIDNTIYIPYDVEDDVLYHELVHTTYHFYRITESTIYYRYPSKGIALNEAMNVELTNLITEDNTYPAYVIFLKYLSNCVDFNYYDYNRYGIEYLFTKLKTKYPDIDIDFIRDSLDALNKLVLKKGEAINYDDKTDLYAEIFKICLANIDFDNSNIYSSFISFLPTFNNFKDKTKMFNYLEEYNNYLLSQGFNDIISVEDFQEKYNLYKNVKGFITGSFGIKPIINDMPPYIVINELGKKVNAPTDDYEVTIINNLNDYILFSLPEYYSIIGTEEYWCKLTSDNHLLSPHTYQPVTITKDNEYIKSSYLPTCTIDFGATKNHEFCYAIRSNTNEIIYQSAPFISYITASIPLNNILASSYITTLDLNLMPSYIYDFMKSGASYGLAYNEDNLIISLDDDVEANFSLLLVNVPYVYDNYLSFKNFISNNYLYLDSNEIFNYLDKYNKALIKNNRPVTIKSSDIKNSCLKYQNVEHLVADKNGLHAVINNGSNWLEVNSDGSLKLLTIDANTRFYDTPSFYEVTRKNAIIHYDILDSPAYLKELASLYDWIPSYDYEQIKFYLNGELLTTDYINGYTIHVGYTFDNNICYSLYKDGTLVYSTSLYEDNTLAIISLSSIFDYCKIKSNSIELTEILTPDIINGYLKDYALSTDITLDEENSINENATLEVIMPDNTNVTYNFADIYIYSYENNTYISGLDILLDTYLLSKPLTLTEIFTYYNIYDPTKTNYIFKEEDLLTLVYNYLELNKAR